MATSLRAFCFSVSCINDVQFLSEKLRELAWSGVPPYMRPNVWRLLLVNDLLMMIYVLFMAIINCFVHINIKVELEVSTCWLA